MSRFQFRKRKKLTKGISLNFSKRGLGFSAGPKGLRVSRSATGRVSGSLGIPGSGLSYRKPLNSTGANAEIDQSDDSLLANILDKQSFISLHGPVFTNKEIRSSLLYLLFFFLSSMAWTLSAMFTSLKVLLNPFLLIAVIFGVQYIRESKKNQRIYIERVERHLSNCQCPGISK